MYLFRAYYVDRINKEEFTREICFERFLSERESYVLAMSKACVMTKENECLTRIEFIAKYNNFNACDVF